MRAGFAIALVAVALAGCGDDKQASKPASTPAATSSGGGAAPKSVDATMKDFEFVPASITVASGGTVTWTDKDSANHNVKFSDEAITGIDNLQQDQSGKVTFDAPGSYAFVCTYHPNMKGTVTVK
jgi:plastocyanin